MKKFISILVAAGIISSVFLGCGTTNEINLNKESKKSKPISNETSKTNDKDQSIENEEKKSEEKQSNPLDVFLKGGELIGNINGNIGVVIDLSRAVREGDEVVATEYYTKYSDQRLNVRIKSDGNNKYIINESSDGKASGIYNVTLDGNKVTGIFTNVSTDVKSSVDLEFNRNGKESKSKNIKVNKDKNEEGKTKENNTSEVSEQSNNKEVTIGFLRNIVNEKILTGGAKVVTLSKEEAKEIENDFVNHKYALMDKYNNKIALYAGIDDPNPSGCSGRFYESTLPNDTKVGLPNYIINGENAWYVYLKDATVAFDGGKANAYAIIGSNGKVYNNKDIYDAAVKGQLKQREFSGKEYKSISPEELSDNYYNSPCPGSVIWGNGSSAGLQISKDNPDPNGWQPPNGN